VAFLSAQTASGGGTYSPAPGVLSEFQFNQTHVQCKVANTVLADGTKMQMFMFSTKIDLVKIDSKGKTVVITGKMTSIVRLRFPNGSSVKLTESVPFVMSAQDNGTPGAGKDTFGLTVVYNPKQPGPGGLNQFKLFGSPATFAGILLSGDVVVK
jgi:hypothetical protein